MFRHVTHEPRHFHPSHQQDSGHMDGHGGWGVCVWLAGWCAACSNPSRVFLTKSWKKTPDRGRDPGEAGGVPNLWKLPECHSEQTQCEWAHVCWSEDGGLRCCSGPLSVMTSAAWWRAAAAHIFSSCLKTSSSFQCMAAVMHLRWNCDFYYYIIFTLIIIIIIE